jgi:UrcA family protein
MTVPMIRTAVATALLALAAPAFAEPAAVTEKLVISTSGLDLATYSGQQALEHRVSNAIDRLCSAEVFASAEPATAMDDCRDAVRAEVQPQIKAMLPVNTVVALR